MEELSLVVGIGSSAGGLNPMLNMFSHFDEIEKMAFVVVPHLDRVYRSNLCLLISRKTKMKTKTIENGERVRPGVVYVLTENKKVIIQNSRLQLKERPEDEKINNAIDTFLVSLAEDQGPKAVGVILSGLGSDGTQGAIQIKRKGGRMIVQEPITAQFNGMPANSIAYDHPDDIVPPKEIPKVLLSYLKETVASPNR